jgi:hypothetical protein
MMTEEENVGKKAEIKRLRAENKALREVADSHSLVMVTILEALAALLPGEDGKKP